MKKNKVGRPSINSNHTTFHTPVSKELYHMILQKSIDQDKPIARVIRCALLAYVKPEIVKIKK